MSITQERLKQLLDYDPQTGHFTWKPRPWLQGKATAWNKRFAGKRAGTLNKVLGYVMIDFDGAPRYAHRLAFIYMTGSVPEMIDHANGNRSDNAWSNLRACTQSQNMYNAALRADNTTGVKGVVLHKKRLHQNRPYQAKLARKSLGYFATAEAAHEAYMRHAREVVGEFARAA